MSKMNVSVSYIFCEKRKPLREKVWECLEKVLSKKYGVSTDTIKVQKDEQGKPYILSSPGFEYNISYTSGVCLIALSERHIGVDVEQVKEMPRNILERCYNKEEQKYVYKGRNQKEKEIRFYEIWTKKEAYVKYLGIGTKKDSMSINVLDKSISSNFQSVYVDGYIMTVYADGNYYTIWERSEL